MRRSSFAVRRDLIASVLLTIVVGIGASPCLAENIDPDDDGSQYAWGENIGWCNAEPQGNSGPGMTVSNTALDGWLWGENIGWISLACSNTSSCGTADYGVVNDGCGNLSGYAWAENAGWISFTCENTGSCGSAAYGVEIDPVTGLFSGTAWGENTGWIRFGSPGPNPYAVRTSWFVPPPDEPAYFTEVAKEGATHLRLWWNTGIPDAQFYEVIRGSLGVLRSTGGDYAAAVDDCIVNAGAGTIAFEVGSGTDTDFFLVRAANCGGKGTADSDGPGQVGSRDAGITTSGNDCP